MKKIFKNKIPFNLFKSNKLFKNSTALRDYKCQLASSWHTSSHNLQGLKLYVEMPNYLGPTNYSARKI